MQEIQVIAREAGVMEYICPTGIVRIHPSKLTPEQFRENLTRAAQRLMREKIKAEEQKAQKGDLHEA